MDQLDERQERYEDEVTAILMREYLREVGIEALELEKQLRQTNPVSKETERRMQRYIAKVFREKYRSQKREARHQVRGKMTFRRLAITACLIALLASTATAGIPYIENAMHILTVREGDGHLDFYPDSEENNKEFTETGIGYDLTLNIGWIPKDYLLDTKEEYDDMVSYTYVNHHDDKEYFYAEKIYGEYTLSIDSENAEVKNVQINHTNAVFTKKYDAENDLFISLTWKEKNGSDILRIGAYNMPEEDVLEIAKSME